MILHITFSDGSNPWVSLPTDRHTIAKHWRRWMKYHPDTAKPQAKSGNFILDYDPAAGRYDLHRVVLRQGNYNACELHNRYKTLGRALAALERLGGAGV